MATRQYIGARYVPKFANPIEWTNNKAYEALEIVTYNNDSYTSRIPVPINTDITNETYWVKTSNFNAQLEAVYEELAELEQSIKAAEYIPFVPTGNERADYKNDTLSCIASYLAHIVGSDCVVGTPVVTQKVACQYEGNGGYLQYLQVNPTDRENSNFVYNETLTIDGVSYHVMNLNCSSFLSLITKCRNYLESPYYYAFNTDPVVDETLLRTMLESGSLDNKPYTFDWLNYLVTYRMAYMMDKSGCATKVLFNGNANNDGEFVQSSLDELETGDIVFFASSDVSGVYKNIFHCGYYLKTLAELNQFGYQYGITFKNFSYDTDDESYGYIVDMSASTDGKTKAQGGYKNTIKITSLWHNGNYIKRAYNRKLYFAKPYSNSFISSKAYCALNGRFPMWHNFFVSERPSLTTGSWFDTENGILKTLSLNLTGISISSGTFDCDTCDPGYYTINGNNVTISNKPNDAAGLHQTLIYLGSDSEYRGTQIYFDASGDCWYRIKGGTWASWKLVNVT